MTDSGPVAPKEKARLDRERRLAEALRANLRRRKTPSPGAAGATDVDKEPETGSQNPDSAPSA